MDALAVLRAAEVPLALVHDEYGHLDGIVTPGSLLAALAGAFAHDMTRTRTRRCVEREDGSWLVSGAASADLLGDRLGVRCPHDRDYSTVAGFALSVLKRIPETGETLQARRLVSSRSSTWTGARSTNCSSAPLAAAAKTQARGDDAPA